MEGSESFDSHSELLSNGAHEWFMQTGYMDFQMGDFNEPQYVEVRALFDKIDQIYKANDVKTSDNPQQQFLLKGREQLLYRSDPNFLGICEKNDFSSVLGTQKVGLKAILGIACMGSYKTFTGPLAGDFNSKDMDASGHGPNFIVFKDVDGKDNDNDENVYYRPKEVQYFLVKDEETKTKVQSMFIGAKEKGLMADELYEDNLNKLKTYEELNNMLPGSAVTEG